MHLFAAVAVRKSFPVMFEWGGEEASLLDAIPSCVSAAGGNNLVELASVTSGTAA